MCNHLHHMYLTINLPAMVFYKQLRPFHLLFMCSNNKISLLRFNQICRPLCRIYVLFLVHWGGIHCSSFLGQLLKFIRMPWKHILIHFDTNAAIVHRITECVAHMDHHLRTSLQTQIEQYCSMLPEMGVNSALILAWSECQKACGFKVSCRVASRSTFFPWRDV